MDDSLQNLIDSLKALADDVMKNEGRPSAQEIANRIGRAVTLAELVQQNLQIASQPLPPELAGNVVAASAVARPFEPSDAQILEEATGSDAPPADAGITTVDDEPSVLGAGVGEQTPQA